MSEEVQICSLGFIYINESIVFVIVGCNLVG